MSSTRHSVPGVAAGFTYQFERALYWLAQSQAGAVVGIETTDDVAVRNTDGTLILEQDKHSTSNNEPFGDRSHDLWNTLAIWIDGLEGGEVAIDTTGFLMVTNKVLPIGIAKYIGDALTEVAIAACIAALEKAGEDPPQKISDFVKRVLRKESRSTLIKLISKVELVDGTQAAAGADLRSQTIAHLQLPEWCVQSANSIMDELLGWLHKTTLGLWQQKIPAWIQRNHFVNQLHAIIAGRKREANRERSEHLIPVADENVGQEKGRPFVKQLHLVTEDDSFVETSIREFIRCNIEKGRLSEEGDITDTDWQAFETALQSRWDKIRARVSRMKKDSPEQDIGFEILTETTEEHREKLAGSDTDHVYLTSGTYHRMADSLDIGWHPRYRELMRETNQP